MHMEVDEAQRIIDDLRSSKKNNERYFKALDEKLGECNTLEELNAACTHIRSNSKNGTYHWSQPRHENAFTVHRTRIMNRKMREKNLLNVPILEKKWQASDFNYGDDVRDPERLPILYNALTCWTNVFLIIGAKHKVATLLVQMARKNEGKTLYLLLLLIKFNGFCIKQDKGWQAADLSPLHKFFFFE